MNDFSLNNRIEYIRKEIGEQATLVVKSVILGNKEGLKCAIIFNKGLVDSKSIDLNILRPLMLNIKEELTNPNILNLTSYINERYLPFGDTNLEKNMEKIITAIRSGDTAILIDCEYDVIIASTRGGEQRSISDPVNESTVRGSREGFVENIQVNMSILRRKIKDKNLKIEIFKVGRRSQNDLAIMYIEDIADKDILKELREKIESIDVDYVTATGMIEQCIEDHPYSLLPQIFGTERPDIITANLMEGRFAIMLDGTPYVLSLPAVFNEFFQGVEDYYHRTLLGNFDRMLRLLATILVISLTSIYLTLVKFNAELIPIKFIEPIVSSRIGIPLTPFMEIILMEITIEFLREGGLRLPSKVGQTLSIAGGLIIGEMAVRSRVVSPITLFVVGISAIASFLIPNYEMTLTIRLLRFIMLILANFVGLLGIGVGFFILIVELVSLDSFGVPYLDYPKNDMKDIFIRAPLWKMKKRPESIPNSNNVRKTDFWEKLRRKNDEE